MTPQKSLRFPAFYRWLKEHEGCILAISWAGASLFDDRDLHWILTDLDDGQLLVELVKGKLPVGEIVLDPKVVDEVELGPDPEEPQSGRFMADLIASDQGERKSLGYLLLAHDFEEARRHETYRH